MTKKQRSHLEQRLLRERERALRVYQRLDEQARTSPGDGDGSITLYPLHMADEGTDTIEQEKDFLLLSKEGRLVYDIDSALRTVYREPEQYGRCIECGGAIALERLDLIPWAQLCLDCQTSEETRVERLSQAA